MMHNKAQQLLVYLKFYKQLVDIITSSTYM